MVDSAWASPPLSRRSWRTVVLAGALGNLRRHVELTKAVNTARGGSVAATGMVWTDAGRCWLTPVVAGVQWRVGVNYNAGVQTEFRVGTKYYKTVSSTSNSTVGSTSKFRSSACTLFFYIRSKATKCVSRPQKNPTNMSVLCSKALYWLDNAYRGSVADPKTRVLNLHRDKNPYHKARTRERWEDPSWPQALTGWQRCSRCDW